MATCDMCGKVIDMPFKCSYCNGVFCEEHHIPEFHHCKSPRDSRFKPPLNLPRKMTRDKERRNLPLFPYDYQQLKPIRIKYAKNRISKKSILGILFFLAFLALILIYIIKILLKM
jgi:hypothetical protein